MSAGVQSVRQLRREDVQPFLPLLDEWLLGDALYGVQHTWPQLYRSDGEGAFFAVVEDGRLLSHCAYRRATLHDGADTQEVVLLGSVATAPSARGRGLAGDVLEAALASLGPDVSAALLWAERPELYVRHGFRSTGEDDCLLLARRPRRPGPEVRLATVADHARLHALHERKPRRVERSLSTMSTLLSTPGMTTVVAERDGAPVAYACTGKGADLQGHWHDLGGDDEDLATLLPAAMHLTGQTEAALLLPPYRADLARLLSDHVVGTAPVPGPMRWGRTPRPGPCWIDGLDSV